jgi:hypothetical protein
MRWGESIIRQREEWGQRAQGAWHVREIRNCFSKVVAGSTGLGSTLKMQKWGKRERNSHELNLSSVTGKVLIFLFTFFFFWWNQNLNQGFKLAKQALYLFSHTSSPFGYEYFFKMGVWVSRTICLGWLWTLILLISASQVADYGCEPRCPTSFHLFFFFNLKKFLFCYSLHVYRVPWKSSSPPLYHSVSSLFLLPPHDILR